jgi:hypothetical protein
MVERYGRVLGKKGLKGGKDVFSVAGTDIFLIKILCISPKVFAFYLQKKAQQGIGVY